MAFIRRKGNAFYLVHNVRKRGRVQQLYLAPLGPVPRITNEVVRKVTRAYPSLEVDWKQLRDPLSRHSLESGLPAALLQRLMVSLRAMHGDLSSLPTSFFEHLDKAEVRRELLALLRNLRATVDQKVAEMEHGVDAGTAGDRSR